MSAVILSTLSDPLTSSGQVHYIVTFCPAWRDALLRPRSLIHHTESLKLSTHPFIEQHDQHNEAVLNQATFRVCGTVFPDPSLVNDFSTIPTGPSQAGAASLHTSLQHTFRRYRHASSIILWLSIPLSLTDSMWTQDQDKTTQKS
jgi:hypothetical protein